MTDSFAFCFDIESRVMGNNIKMHNTSNLTSNPEVKVDFIVFSKLKMSTLEPFAQM